MRQQSKHFRWEYTSHTVFSEDVWWCSRQNVFKPLDHGLLARHNQTGHESLPLGLPLVAYRFHVLCFFTNVRKCGVKNVKTLGKICKKRRVTSIYIANISSQMLKAVLELKFYLVRGNENVKTAHTVNIGKNIYIM